MFTLDPKMKKELLYDLFQAYFDARRNKRKTINALEFEVDFESKLIVLHEEICQQKYKISPSICFINFKPVRREIFAATFRDRVVHHLLFNYINPIFDPTFINDSYSCRKGKGVHYGVNRIDKFIRSCTQNYQEEAYILKLDIKGYFMSMDRQILYDKVMKTLRKKEAKLTCPIALIDYLLQRIVFNDCTQNCSIKGRQSDWQGLPASKSLFCAEEGKGFPIGNLTSQLFGNIYMNDFDHFVKGALKIKYYGRYVDDFILIDKGKKRLKESMTYINDYLQENLGLQVHEKKIYLQNDKKGVEFLGIRIKHHRRYVGNRIKSNFYETILDYSNQIKSLDCKLSNAFLEQFRASINSYLGCLSHANTYQLRKKTIWQMHRYIWTKVGMYGGYKKAVLR